MRLVSRFTTPLTDDGVEQGRFGSSQNHCPAAMNCIEADPPFDGIAAGGVAGQVADRANRQNRQQAAGKEDTQTLVGRERLEV